MSAGRKRCEPGSWGAGARPTRLSSRWLSRYGSCCWCDNGDYNNKTGWYGWSDEGQNEAYDWGNTDLPALPAELSGLGYCDSHCHIDYLLHNQRQGGIEWSCKSTVCRYWEADAGSCPYGNDCEFAHGPEDLQPRPQLNLEDLETFRKEHLGVMAPIPSGLSAAPVLRCAITNCCEVESIADTTFLMREAEHVLGGTLFCTFGCHPHNYRQYGDEMENLLLAAVEACGSRAVGWGECGLDYFKNFWDAGCPKERERMIEVFARQVRLAAWRDMPLVVHSRDAEADTLRVLRQYLPREHKVHVHAFQGSADFMEEILREFPNCMFGVSAVLLKPYPIEAAIEIAKRCPLDRLLLETDSPFLAGEPREIPLLAVEVAKRRGNVGAAEVLSASSRNCERLYGLTARWRQQPKEVAGGLANSWTSLPAGKYQTDDGGGAVWPLRAN